jgi:MFS transporter, FSR family, fosmidomycin resistance protein
MAPSVVVRRLRGAAIFVFVLLCIEFLDEFVFGAREAAWPVIRDDLHLSYEQIGLLLGIPELIATFIEPWLGILGDVWRRRVIVLGGGVFFMVSLFLTAISHNFGILLISFIVFYPASGAFVSLSQSTLMDLDPKRHEQNMARWTFAGSAGVVVGSLALGVLVAAGRSWRDAFLLSGFFALILLIVAWRFPSTNGTTQEPTANLVQGFKTGISGALRALRRREVLRWLVLLEFGDLMLDVLLGFLALYFVDVVGVSEGQAGLAVAVWTGAGLLGDLLIIPVLERVRGLSYLRFSAVLEFVLFTAFLLTPDFTAKLVILALLGIFNAGWYAILQGQLYSAMPGQSGTVMSVSNVSGLLGSVIPLALGMVAERLGLGVAVWLLLLGPIALLIGLPRRRRAQGSGGSQIPL